MARYDRGYDYGLRGWSDTVRPRDLAERGGTFGYAAGAGYDAAMRRAASLPNRVTASYNRDYVYPRPDDRSVNYTSYGGDVEGRIGDMRQYQRPYGTIGGTSTWRGGGRPVGWERGYAGYDRTYVARPRPGGGYDRGMRAGGGYDRGMRPFRGYDSGFDQGLRGFGGYGGGW